MLKCVESNDRSDLKTAFFVAFRWRACFPTCWFNLYASLQLIPRFSKQHWSLVCSHNWGSTLGGRARRYIGLTDMLRHNVLSFHLQDSCICCAVNLHFFFFFLQLKFCSAIQVATLDDSRELASWPPFLVDIRKPQSGVVSCCISLSVGKPRKFSDRLAFWL